MKELKDILTESVFDVDDHDDLSMNDIIKGLNTHPKNLQELCDAICEYIKIIRPKKRGDVVDLNWIDTSSLINLNYAFRFTGDYKRLYDFAIDKWDVSNIKEMYGTFEGCTYFTGRGLNNWNVSKVKDMSGMFANCANFNEDLSRWDVSNVEDMSWMFSGCTHFEGKGLEKWDVGKVENMEGMFEDCLDFNANLSRWDVWSVLNIKSMFNRCRKFEGKGLDRWKLNNKMLYDIEHADIYSDIRLVFNDCRSLKNIPEWYKVPEHYA